MRNYSLLPYLSINKSFCKNGHKYAYLIPALAAGNAFDLGIEMQFQENR